MQVETITDEDIAKKVQAGEVDNFGVLVDRYESKLRRYCQKFIARDDDVTDMVQDVFISAYQNIQGFDTSMRFSPWIYRIAHNTCLNTLRKKRWLIDMIDFDAFVSHHVYEDPKESEREREDMRTMLDKQLTKLSPKYREILTLHYYEDMAYKDIADVLQIPIGTVSIRIRRAKEALRQLLETNL